MDPAQLRLGKSIAKAALRLYGSEADALLGDNKTTARFRGLLGSDTGVKLLAKRVSERMQPWLQSELGIHTQTPDVVSAVEDVADVIDAYQPARTGVEAAAHPLKLYQSITDIASTARSPLDASADRLAVFDQALIVAIDILGKLAPKADGFAAQALIYLVQQTDQILEKQDESTDRILQQLGVNQDEIKRSVQDVHRLIAEGRRRVPPHTSNMTGVVALLSEPRMARYLELMGGDPEKALALYAWNINMSGELYKGIAFTEVVIRNSINQALRAWNTAPDGSPCPDWLLRPGRQLAELLQKDPRLSVREDESMRWPIRRAEDVAREKGRAVTHDDVLAQMSLGTWRSLMPRDGRRGRARRDLWDVCLSRAFPFHNASEPPSLLSNHLDNICRTRNRIAHLEPVLDGGKIEITRIGMMAFVKAIDPAAQEWFDGAQDIQGELHRRPTLN